MRAEEIRHAFLNYFAEQGHSVIPSSTLVPVGDDTLLFTNAGMVQFKDAFLGNNRGYVRATSSQRCVRAGGKHNDLENVGYTARHHTFFEMLGNFSFGDYFKREAIAFAWTFLTTVLQLPKEKLWVTVYQEDEEAASIWLNEMKIDPKRFSRCGEKDNFWAMGDTGPCGPCTEIFYDHGPEIPGGPPGTPEADGDRYIEIWNLVFMQFNRNEAGQLIPLPKPSVDTGMGLERIAAVMQGVHNNYEIDLFVSLIQAAAKLLQVKDGTHQSLRVIADHIRSASFLITDGVLPSNEGRGYVLRRIIRRALRHGHRLGATDLFFYQLVPVLVKEMGKAYPELVKAEGQVMRVLRKEEEQFAKTLHQGMGLLESVLSDLKGTLIPGDVIFKLYDTYGFPVDLTADFAREKALKLDMAGFEKAMAEQKERARQSQSFGAKQSSVAVNFDTVFKGYETLSLKTRCLALFQEEQSTQQLSEKNQGWVVLSDTPFYAESGGQVGDTGLIKTERGVFCVTDTQKMGNAIVHLGYMLKGTLSVGEDVSASVEGASRCQTAANHSATHLLHAALRALLGEHVMQKGSLVTPMRLRFDFTQDSPVDRAMLNQLEDMVNAKIRENSVIETHVMDMEQAIASGAVALFGEKYNKDVRVLSMGGVFSKELCGGTHAKRTGDIGLFKIISEGGVAAGVRRIEACSGQAACAFVREQQGVIESLSVLMKAEAAQVVDRVQTLLESQKQLNKQIDGLQQRLVSSAGQDLLKAVQLVQGVSVLAVQLPTGSPKIMRETLDNLKQRLKQGVIVLGCSENEKVTLVAGVTSDLSKQIHAGKLASFLSQKVGGRGGGRPDMAEGGGHLPDELPAALESVISWVEQALVT